MIDDILFGRKAGDVSVNAAQVGGTIVPSTVLGSGVIKVKGIDSASG